MNVVIIDVHNRLEAKYPVDERPQVPFLQRPSFVHASPPLSSSAINSNWPTLFFFVARDLYSAYVRRRQGIFVSLVFHSVVYIFKFRALLTGIIIFQKINFLSRFLKKDEIHQTPFRLLKWPRTVRRQNSAFSKIDLKKNGWSKKN